ncbi:MAG TPA: hypothetical protein VN667_12770 [Burkholderiales bacterium]|nr:hypothetical protein [Burkholderiales bacterium]
MTISIGDIAGIILAVATTSSLIYIARQVNLTRQQTKGQFLLALDDQFDSTNAITRRLTQEPNFKPRGEEWVDVWRLMNVFERIHVMVEDGILDVALVDRLYGIRLRILLGNDAVFEYVKGAGEEWQDFIDICYAVADQRMKGRPGERDRAFRDRVYQLSKDTRSAEHPFRIVGDAE